MRGQPERLPTPVPVTAARAWEIVTEVTRGKTGGWAGFANTQIGSPNLPAAGAVALGLASIAHWPCERLEGEEVLMSKS